MWNEPTPEHLAGFPEIESTDAIPLEQKVVRAHFFLGGSDWYAVEYDPDQRLFFGYAILNNDFQSAEWGYFHLDELRSVRTREGFEVDRDLYFEPQQARDVPKIRRGMGWSPRSDVPIVHPGSPKPFPSPVKVAENLYAVRNGRSVEIRERGTDRLIDKLTPLPEWGENWAWNVTPSGKSVYVHRIGF